MKFKFAFSFSKTEHKFGFRFWKWDIGGFYSVQEAEDVKKDLSKAGFLSFEKKDEAKELDREKSDSGKLLFLALFDPKIESRIWHATKKFINKALKIFSVSFENIEVKGTLNDPFYDSIALGMSNGCYYPCWENENEGWSAKGEIILEVTFFNAVFFAFSIIYETIFLSFLLWRGAKLAKKNPNGENLGTVRRWIFLKAREAL